MNPALVRRQAALAGVALLAALAALALARLDDAGGAEGAATPAGAVAPSVPRWQEAIASTWGPGSYGRETECGVQLTEKTRGLAHPVLPCGVDLVLSFQGRTVRAEVVDRGTHTGSAELELTEALARDLDFTGPQAVRWQFAR